MCDCREDEYNRAIETGIKNQYIGAPEKKPKIRNKRNSPFLMQWKNEDDTSEKLNPLYMNREKVHLGFGKGYIVDSCICVLYRLEWICISNERNLNIWNHCCQFVNKL